MFCLHVCLCSTHRLDAQEGQEKALDILELKLRVVVSHHMYVHWGLNLGLMQENLLLPAETPLQLPNSGIDTTLSKIIQRSYVTPLNRIQINDH